MGLCVVLLVTLFCGTRGTVLTGNVALNTKAVQSSTIDWTGVANHAIDGNKNSDYKGNSCTGTKYESNPWWRVDLRWEYSVRRVVITTRKGYVITGAQIRIGNSLVNNGNYNTLAATVVSGTATYEFAPIKGRYLNIILPGSSKVLYLCEVEVFAVKEKLSTCSCGQTGNLALGGDAQQSSTLGNYVARNAIDGVTHSNKYLGSCSYTRSFYPWWRVDLKDTYRISRVSITSRKDCCPGSLTGAQIRIGNSLANSGNNNPLAATVTSIPIGGTKTFAFQPMKGRYVNIYLPGKNSYLTVCEVQVFAEIETPRCTCVPRNLAVGAEAVQSSTPNPLGIAKHAVDGNFQTDFKLGSCTLASGEKPWWRVDLKNTYKITRVKITSQKGCCWKTTYISIGNSLENNIKKNKLVKIVYNMPAGQTKTFKIKPTEGRFVNIFHRYGKTNLTLCEVEVFAD